MAGLINAEEQRILDAITCKTAYTAETRYAALSTTTPTEAGATFTEPSAGAYARKALTAATWTAATGGDPSSTSYGAQITFNAATGGWGTLTHAGWFSVLTLGTGLPQFWMTLTQAKAVQTNDSVSFAANTFLVKLGDPIDVYT